MDKKKEIRRFFLLQVNDALFPIGGYSHSQGLETYIQQGRVHDEKTAAEYISKKLKLNLACTDLLGVRLAYEYALKEDVDALDTLEEILGASRIPMEQRGIQKNGFPLYEDGLQTSTGKNSYGKERSF